MKSTQSSPELLLPSGPAEGSLGTGNAWGKEVVASFPVGPPLHVDGVTYKGVGFIAPVDGCVVKELWISAGVLAAGGTNTLALDNYDKSGNAARNLLSTTNVDPTAVPAVVLEGEELTLTTTLANRVMDAGDVLNFVLVVGTETTQGEGYSISALILVPENN